ncbi:flagellar basal body-associated protein FliL [Aestuariibius insulae]|uniref:flagellar basal body-associated FliL family protein n=1 Tax=Aestuariibius insulae TaxID=2058287 RepID=UPI00345F0D5F
MAETEDTDIPAKKKSKLPLVLGLVLALAGGGGAFYAIWSGMLLAPEMEETAQTPAELLEPVAFVSLDPIVISLPRSSAHKHLRFRAEVEVEPAYQEEVAALKPRIIDVMHTYLGALEPEQIEMPGALARLRGQMLRRLRVVAGEGRIRDLLIAEFVLD